VERQLAMRTVVEWFGNLTFARQTDVLAQLQAQHEQSRAAKRTELENQLAALGYSIAKRRGRPKGARNSGAPTNGKKRPAKAKYRDPKTNETWSGRGRMASWLKGKQDAGEKIEKYLI
jgi:DNA-binding protein H-NS